MEQIVINPKPEWITYDDIYDLLHKAHKSNVEKGINTDTVNLSPEELEKRAKRDDQCFVALVDDKLVGLTSVRIVERNKLYAKGKTALQKWVAVLPEYRNCHISSRLHDAVVDFAKEADVNQIELHTAFDNTEMQKASLKWGFKYVDFRRISNLDHYTVIMMKWLNRRPSPLFLIRIRYLATKIYTVIRFRSKRAADQ